MYGTKHAASVILLCLLISAVGCGGRPNLSLDENVARDSLTTALESWKKGERPESLKDRSPSIIVGDPIWIEGQRLVSYKVHDQGQSDGVNLHCKVDLVLANQQGKQSRQTITYIVGTSPVITVFPK